MVGLVLVSHSPELAAAVKALAGQQTQGRAAIAAVGGTGDPDQPFGTDALAILAAIEHVYHDDGVLVLMDLGSALLSAETALEFLDPAQAACVRLCAAPFVEGAMAAAVQASIGMSLDACEAEALAALTPKQSSLGQPPALAATGQQTAGEAVASPAATVSARATLVNPAGLHFGPAVQVVQLAAAHQASLTLANRTTGAGPADGRRFNQVMALGAGLGHEVELTAQGPDAQALVDRLVALIAGGFGERETSQPAAPVGQPGPTAGQGRMVLAGVPASAGVAVGVAVILHDEDDAPLRRTVDDPAAEWARYQAAAARAAGDLTALAARMAQELGPEQSRIFQAHALLLEDEDLAGAVHAAIAGEQINAEAALHEVFSAEAERLAGMSGERFQARAVDLHDLARRLLRELGGSAAAQPGLELPRGAVLVARDLTPSQTAGLQGRDLAGFATALGGPTSHSAILARSMGLPAVVGLGEAALAQVTAGERVALDGAAGALILAPDDATVAAFTAQARAAAAARAAEWAAAGAPVHRSDGRRVEVAANLASAAEAALAVQAGAEAVGLLRTEFLFQDRLEPPDEEEQYAAYREVVETMAGRPVVIRTLDIGGDKPASYLQLPAEANPFLGWRAIRISLAMPEFFKVQLRALLRAGAHGPVRVLFPMIATVEEVVQAQGLLRQAAADLAARGAVYAGSPEVGVMIEVPSAVWLADQLAPLVDFFSIGTNDLTQYTFAADRGNARVAQVGHALHPAVLRQIEHVIEAAHAAGKWVGLCGELAAQPEAIPVLLNLGLDEFSMSPAAIPRAKGLLRAAAGASEFRRDRTS